MEDSTAREVIRLIELNEIIESDDDKIEGIAERFPNEYNNDQEYVAFQMEIGKLVADIMSKK